MPLAQEMDLQYYWVSQSESGEPGCKLPRANRPPPAESRAK